jgi:hypothetical protein
MNDLEKRSGAVLGVIAYLIAMGAGFACEVPVITVLLRAAAAGAGGFVLGRLLGHVVLHAFLDDVAESRRKQAEPKTDES